MIRQKLWERLGTTADPDGRDDADLLSLPILQEPGQSSPMSRRTFIELIGFSAAALTIESCQAPEQKIVPALRKPVEMTPGVASWYASTCGGCSAACGVLVKVRDGRPIKLEGNPDHPLSRGGLCAVAHGMVFSLFDGDRLRGPRIGTNNATWAQIDADIDKKLAAIKTSGGKVRLLTSTITSPTSCQVVENFLAQFADGKHIEYEHRSVAAIREAHLRSHGAAILPHYRFDKASLVVSFDADFLGTWISPVEFARSYAERRTPVPAKAGGDGRMLRHVQIESQMSLTGSNADRRVRISPSESVAVLLTVARHIAQRRGVNDSIASSLASAAGENLDGKLRNAMQGIADELWSHRSESLVISGSNNIDEQYLVNAINEMLGSYGSTVDISHPSQQRGGSDAEMAALVEQMNAGQIAALIIQDANPAYDYPDAITFKNGMKKVPLTIVLNPSLDETASHAAYICPGNHFLEAWNDAEPVRGIYSLAQPAIAPLFNTRAWQESLMRWSGDSRSFYNMLRESWRTQMLPFATDAPSFDDFWDKSLQEGVFLTDVQELPPSSFTAEALPTSISALRRQPAPSDALWLALYEKSALRNGTHANNPWLHELPDPISKITWDNYLCVSPDLARREGLEEGAMVRVTSLKTILQLPVHIQPGQHDRVVAVALGYGRTRAGKVGSNLGVNASPLIGFDGSTFSYTAGGVRIEKTGEGRRLATTQPHDSLEGRPIVKETTLEAFSRGEAIEREWKEESLWQEQKFTGHKWGMAIDLNRCIGCSACMLSCQAENNVPVVGRDEVLNQREMHWLRVDRYFDDDPEQQKVHYQLVMCGNCDNATCENVCPVLATVHSSEGINMQVYNRCVCTRYCANNCAYKARRFNWFDYQHDDPIANLALNPDVTVRSRGVMEKCTFCVQRIEEARIRARNENRPIADGEIQTACQQSCPAQAITFGDVNDPNSRVAQSKHDRRGFLLLEELNIRPSVTFLARVRNIEEA
jgi:molybdopterin-containing oxidoreductase family iron-sulfur binding subunit